MKNVNPEPVFDEDDSAQPNSAANDHSGEEDRTGRNPTKDTDFGATRVKKIDPREASPGAAAATGNRDATPAGAAEGLDVSEELARMIREDQEEIHGPRDFDRRARATNPQDESQQTKPQQTEAQQPETQKADADQTPVLTEDDEKFLEKVTSEMEMPPPLPPRRATLISDDGELTEKTEEEALEQAKDVPLPKAPPGEKEQLQAKMKEEKQSQTWKERWNQMSFVPASAANLYFSTPSIWPIKVCSQFKRVQISS